MQDCVSPAPTLSPLLPPARRETMPPWSRDSCACQSIQASQQHRSSVARKAVVELLLGACLPRLAAALSSGTGDGGGSDMHSPAAAPQALHASRSAPQALLCMLADTLRTDSLKPAVALYLQQQQQEAVALVQVVRCCTGLPADPPEGWQQPETQAEAHVAAFQLLSTCSLRAAADPSHSGSRSSPRPALALLARYVPHAAAVLSAVAAQQYPLRKVHVLSLCTCMAAMLTNLIDAGSSQVGRAELAGWAAAADAGLRLLPLLCSELGTEQPSAAVVAAGEQPAALLASAIFQLYRAGTRLLSGSSLLSQRGGEDPSTLLALMMRVHASGCRKLHWFAADPARLQQCSGWEPGPAAAALLQTLEANLQSFSWLHHGLHSQVKADEKLRWVGPSGRGVPCITGWGRKGATFTVQARVRPPNLPPSQAAPPRPLLRALDSHQGCVGHCCSRACSQQRPARAAGDEHNTICAGLLLRMLPPAGQRPSLWARSEGRTRAADRGRACMQCSRGEEGHLHCPGFPVCSQCLNRLLGMLHALWCAHTVANAPPTSLQRIYLVSIYTLLQAGCTEPLLAARLLLSGLVSAVVERAPPAESGLLPLVSCLGAVVPANTLWHSTLRQPHL